MLYQNDPQPNYNKLQQFICLSLSLVEYKTDTLTWQTSSNMYTTPNEVSSRFENVVVKCPSSKLLHKLFFIVHKVDVSLWFIHINAIKENFIFVLVFVYIQTIKYILKKNGKSAKLIANNVISGVQLQYNIRTVQGFVFVFLDTWVVLYFFVYFCCLFSI